MTLISEMLSMEHQGFQWLKTVQTLYQSPTLLQNEEKLLAGYGLGGFVAILMLKRSEIETICDSDSTTGMIERV